MKKSLLMPLIGGFALSVLAGCGAKSKEVVVESTLDYVIANKTSLDIHTKYHVTGVAPYSFKKGDGQSYTADAIWFFAKGTDGTSYIGGKVVLDGDIKHGEDGFKLTKDSSEVLARVEKELLNKGVDTTYTFEVNYFRLQFGSYSNTGVEILSYTAAA